LKELTEWEGSKEADSGRRQFHGALEMRCKSSANFVYSMDILFRFFTSFISCSVFRLSFSSFCYPSVGSGCLASLPGLGLIVFWEIGFKGDWGNFLTELTNLIECEGNREFKLRQAAILWHFSQAMQFLLELCWLRGYFVPVFHQFCVLFGVSPVV
jgi:hypothetical protein